MKTQFKDFLIKIILRIFSDHDILAAIFETAKSDTVYSIDIRQGFSDARLEFLTKDNEGTAREIFFDPLYLTDSSFRVKRKFIFRKR